jgi:hypothetical protein
VQESVVETALITCRAGHSLTPDNVVLESAGPSSVSASAATRHGGTARNKDCLQLRLKFGKTSAMTYQVARSGTKSPSFHRSCGPAFRGGSIKKDSEFQIDPFFARMSARLCHNFKQTQAMLERLPQSQVFRQPVRRADTQYPFIHTVPLWRPVVFRCFGAFRTARRLLSSRSGSC